jgi:pyruvate dehydrogenase E2 component (dihydrolipoamide acetyltransferase)
MPAEILVPPLSQTMDTLTLVEWYKKPGDEIKKGEYLFSVETDKATLDVESPETGILYEVLANPLDEVKIRSVIGVILLPGETADGLIFHPEKDSPETPTPKNKKQALQTKKVESASEVEGRIFASPRAKKTAREKGIDLEKAQASGPRGMIIERDVEKISKDEPKEKIQQSNKIRKIIAKRMMQSHLETAPVSYMREVDASQFSQMRQEIKNSIKDKALNITFTDLFIRAICLALAEHPDFNAVVEDGDLLIKSHINLSLAVDNDRGLIVPVIKNADQLSIREISKQRKMLITRVNNNTLNQGNMEDGTFTISNLGSLGVDFFTPIINPPQVAIVGIGRIREVPAVHNGGIFIKNKVGISLTCDHRFIDGAPAARFLETFTQIIENPKIENFD